MTISRSKQVGTVLFASCLSAGILSSCVSFHGQQPDQPPATTTATATGADEATTPEDQNNRVRRNMVIVQDAAEAYAVAHKGAYPEKVDLAFKVYFPGGNPQAKKPGKALINPFSGRAEWPTPGSVEDIAQVRAEYPTLMEEGKIEYNLVGGVAYAIIGGGAEQKRLPVLYHGTSGTLVLSNATFATRIPRHLNAKITLANPDDFDKVMGTSPLVGLDIKCVRATDGDLEKIAGSENIEKLDLSQTGITAAALASLADLSGLKSIDLSDTNIDGPSLSALSSIPHLQRVILQRTPVDDDTLKQLSQYRDLRELDLRDTRINDKHLDAISKMSRLESLYLSGHFSAENLASLESVPTKLLVIEHSDISPESLKSLQQKNPKRKITIQK